MKTRWMPIWTGLLCLIVVGSARAGGRTCYSGQIGGHSHAQLYLEQEPVADGAYVGGYRYEQFGQLLYLTQVSRKHGQLVLEESHSGQVSGRFTGKVDQASGTFSGVWTSADGKRKLPFSFERIAETGEVSENRQGRFTLSVSYPRFSAAGAFHRAVNRQARRNAQQKLEQLAKAYQSITLNLGPEEPAYEASVNVEVIFADESTISLLYQQYFYTGGAHGNTVYWAMNYRWRDGKLVEADLAQLLRGGEGDYLKRLNHLCVEELRRQGASWPQDVKFSRQSPPTVNVMRGGLLFTFAPYEAGSYAEGSYWALVRFDQIRDLMTTDTAARGCDHLLWPYAAARWFQ